MKKNLLILLLSLTTGFAHASNLMDLPQSEVDSIRRGIDILYDLDYEAAITNFTSLLPTWQDHPAPWFFTAMVWWIKCSQYDDLEKSGTLFTRAINQAIAKARGLLAKNPGDPAGVFFLAGSLGFSGRFHLMQNNLVSAVTTGWEAYRLLQANTDAFKDAPDILLGSGLFNFYAGRIPDQVKTIARMLGIKGDWQLGLRQLERAGREGVFAKTEAEIALAHLYTYDLRDGHKGAALTKALMERYPHNPEFRLQYAENLLASGRYSHAIETVKEGLALTDETWYKPTHRFRFLCLMGKLYHTARDFNSSLEWLNQAIALRDRATQGNFLAWAHVRRGDALVNLGNPALGLKDYQRGLQLDELGSAGRAARQRIDKLRKK